MLGASHWVEMVQVRLVKVMVQLLLRRSLMVQALALWIPWRMLQISHDCARLVVLALSSVHLLLAGMPVWQLMRTLPVLNLNARLQPQRLPWPPMSWMLVPS